MTLSVITGRSKETMICDDTTSRHLALASKGFNCLTKVADMQSLYASRYDDATLASSKQCLSEGQARNGCGNAERVFSLVSATCDFSDIAGYSA